MTYALPFIRLVAAGNLYGGPERWSWSLALAPSFNNPPYGEPTTVPSSVITAVENFHKTTSMISVAASLDTIKFNLIGIDGRYANPTSVEHVDTTPANGGYASVYPYPQLALAVTLRTAVTRGYANRGRFYIPVPGFNIPVTTDPRISAANAQTVATAATTMLNALNTSVTGFRCAVVSKVGTGTQRFVTNVEVGRVVDTIRSRRTSLPEDHQAGATLTP